MGMGGVKLLYLLLIVQLLTQLATGAPPMVKPNCRERCGDIMIPYPFGMGSRDCYEDEWYEIECINNTKPFLTRLNRAEVLNISLQDTSSIPYPYTSSIPYPYSKLTVKGPIISSNKSCSHTFGAGGKIPLVNLTGSPFLFLSNVFVAVGCNTRFVMTDDSTQPVVGCNSRCSQEDQDRLDWAQVFLNFSSRYDPYCNGSNNCCQASVSSSLEVFNPSFQSIGGDRGGCNLAFLADPAWLYQQTYMVKQLQYVPLALSWKMESNRLYSNGFYCSSISTNGSLVSGCLCPYGYEGNPYLGRSGCKDIDECKHPHEYGCKGITKCVNTFGSYKCVLNPVWIILIIIGGVIGVLTILFGIWWVYKIVKRKRKIELKRMYFKRNGGLLLQQQITSTDGGLQKTKVFSSKELEKATDQFNENRILGQGGQGTVYKGMLTDGRIVAVKKSTLVDEEKLQEFINEVVILSQINHRNVVKLLGCCLETEVPLLVYEFIPNGSLFQYLHHQNDDVPFSWEMRLQIATEAAGAVAYLHSAASIPIYHRDIKSTNILLDEKLRAKVSDFGTSRSIAVEQTHLTTHVQGTFGYLDPEYFQSSQFTAKSDVYSFGVVLIELLSGQKPICWGRSEESRSLATYFNLLMEEKKLFEIVDITIMQQKHEQQIIAVANLAKRCLNLYGRFRPTMKEVAIELEHIRSSSKRNLSIQQNTEEPNAIHEVMVLDANPIGPNYDFNDATSTLSFEVDPLISYQTW